MSGNFLVVTSIEFSNIISYLTSTTTNHSKALSIIRNFSSLEYVKERNYYTISKKEAWSYFSKNYSKALSNKNILDIDELLIASKN